MNTIELSLPDAMNKREIGDIYRDGKSTDYYILSQVQFHEEMFYVAISLVNGNRYIDPQTSIERATTGLKFIGRDVKIILSK